MPKSQIEEYEKEKQFADKKIADMYAIIDGGYDPRSDAAIEEYNKDLQSGYLAGEDEATKKADEMNRKLEYVDYSQLYGYLDEINTSYNASAADSSVSSVPGKEVFDGWSSGVEQLKE